MYKTVKHNKRIWRRNNRIKEREGGREREREREAEVIG